MNQFIYSMTRFMPDKLFIYAKYHHIFHKYPNLSSPKSFNEKLQWLKLYYRDPKYTELVDKYSVKSYVKEKVGEDYLIPTLGVWDHFDDINFNQLPTQFVLKCTHDSGSIVVCEDKSTFNVSLAKKKLEERLHKNYFYVGREWPYKNVKPRIIAEPFIDSIGKPDSIEYKVTCMNGKVDFITVCRGKAHSTHEARTNDHYDREWNKINFYVTYKPSGLVFQKPSFLDEMIDVSEKLAEGIPYLRVDLYYIDEQIKFGELTFYTWQGFCNFEPKEYDEILGSRLILPTNKIV